MKKETMKRFMEAFESILKESDIETAIESTCNYDYEF